MASAQRFPHLLSPLDIRGHTVRNRILSTAHMTTLVSGGVPGDDLVAYHEARAALADDLADYGGDVRLVGDYLAPRTAEEAVLEGLKVGARLCQCIGGRSRTPDSTRPPRPLTLSFCHN